MSNTIAGRHRRGPLRPRATGVTGVILLFSAALSAIAAISPPAAASVRYITRGEAAGIKLPYEASNLLHTPVTTEQAKAALDQARTYLGVPYVWGGESRSGIDCSGLILAAYRAVIPGLVFQAWGAPVSQDVAAIDMYYYNTVPLDLASVRAGDLIFMKSETSKLAVSHVVMVKSTRSGMVTFINATTRYGKVVEETWSTDSAEWKARYVGAGRLTTVSVAK